MKKCCGAHIVQPNKPNIAWPSIYPVKLLLLVSCIFGSLKRNLKIYCDAIELSRLSIGSAREGSFIKRSSSLNNNKNNNQKIVISFPMYIWSCGQSIDRQVNFGWSQHQTKFFEDGKKRKCFPFRIWIIQSQRERFNIHFELKRHKILNEKWNWSRDQFHLRICDERINSLCWIKFDSLLKPQTDYIKCQNGDWNAVTIRILEELEAIMHCQ